MQRSQVESTQCRGTCGVTASRGMGGSRRRGRQLTEMQHHCGWRAGHSSETRYEKGFRVIATKEVASVITAIISTESITGVKICSSVRSAWHENVHNCNPEVAERSIQTRYVRVQEDSSEKDGCTQHINPNSILPIRPRFQGTNDVLRDVNATVSQRNAKDCRRC